MRRSVVLLAIALCGCKSGCDRAPGGPAGSPSASGSTAAEVAPINRFAHDLYEEQRAGDQNFVLAPALVASAVGWTYEGAKGVTAKQIASTLHLEAVPNVTKELEKRRDAVAASVGDTVMLRAATRVWVDDSVTLTDLYRKSTEGNDAPIALLGFSKDAAGSRAALNTWSNARLGGKRDSVAWPGAVDDKTRLVVTVGAYFHPRWQQGFDPSRTRLVPFEYKLNSEGLAPTMVQAGKFLYADLDWLEFLEIPCTTGSVVVDFLLAKRGHPLQVVEKAVTSGKLEGWLAKAQSRDVEVYLPRFSIRTQMGLATPLAKLGMSSAFGMQADFSNLATPSDGLALSEVVHDATVEIDEGTTVEPEPSRPAASASAPVAVKDSWVRFAASRPFVFVVRDSKSGTILLVGRFSRP